MTYVAIIASDDFSFGVARMYQGISRDTDRVRVFRDEGDARMWIRSLDAIDHGPEEG